MPGATGLAYLSFDHFFFFFLRAPPAWPEQKKAQEAGVIFLRFAVPGGTAANKQTSPESDGVRLWSQSDGVRL